MLKIQIMHR